MIEGVQLEDIDRLWPHVEPALSRACAYSDGKLDTRDIYTALMERDMQLWLVPSGVWVTTIKAYPKTRRCEIVAAAGKFDDWFTSFDELKSWAKEYECDAIEYHGRKGWGRKCGHPEIHRSYRVRI